MLLFVQMGLGEDGENEQFLRALLHQRNLNVFLALIEKKTNPQILNRR